MSTAVRLAVLSTSVILAATVLHAQMPPAGSTPQQPPPIFRARTEVVHLDIVVVDELGTPIRGLTRDDFTLLDRRRPQAIDVFQEVAVAPTLSAVPSLLSLASTTRIDVASNAVAPTDRLIVIVLDDLHTYRGRAQTVKTIARGLVEKLGPHSSMALLQTGGENSVEVTSDRSRLLAAIDAFKARRAERRPIQACDQPGVIHFGAESTGLPTDQGCSQQEVSADLSLYKTLEDAARILGGRDSRRRVFVLVSENLAKNLSGLFEVSDPPGDVVDSGGYATGGGADALAANQLRPISVHDIGLLNMMKAFRQGGIVTYAIDPRGEVKTSDLMRECSPNLTGWGEGKTSGFDPCEGPPDQPPAWNNWIRQSQRGLEYVTQASGGFAVVNTNDFEGGIARIANDLDNYYLLGFTPTDRNSKGARALRVQVRNHPEYVLRYRPTYQLDNEPKAPKADPLSTLVSGPVGGGDLPLRLYAIAMPYSDKESRVAVSVELSVPRQSMASADESMLDEIRYGIFAIDLKGARVRQQTGSGARVVLRPRPGNRVPPDQVSYQIAATLALAPGRYQLRAGALSTKLGAGGSAYLSFDVPDFRKDAVMVTDLLIGYADGPHVPIARNQSRAGGPPADILPFEPTLDREFRAADTLRLYFRAVAPKAQTISATISALAPDGHALLTFDRALPASAPVLDTRLPLSQLVPGAYRLHVKVTDGKNTADRDVGFVIK